MDRQEGYYWVKHPNEIKHQVGHYQDNSWYIAGVLISYEDQDFEHINEVRIKQPGELPELYKNK